MAWCSVKHRDNFTLPISEAVTRLWNRQCPLASSGISCAVPSGAIHTESPQRDLFVRYITRDPLSTAVCPVPVSIYFTQFSLGFNCERCNIHVFLDCITIFHAVSSSKLLHMLNWKNSGLSWPSTSTNRIPFFWIQIHRHVLCTSHIGETESSVSQTTSSVICPQEGKSTRKWDDCKVKGKVVPVLSEAPGHEDVLGEWRYSSTNSLTSALDGGEWSASGPCRFTPRERAPDNHLTGVWVGHRAGLDVVAKRRNSCLAKNRTPVVQPIAHSLYWLSYS
jgi:hypothetical protein